MLSVTVTLVAAMLAAGASAASAEPRFTGEKARPQAMPAPESSCREFAVDSQIALRRVDSAPEREAELIEFTVTVSVSNPCNEPLQVQYGSSVAYQSNFPPLAQAAGQPPGCIGQQVSFSGVVPPHQNQPFAFRSQACAYPTAAPEPARVAVESGRVVTDRGERPVPSLSRALP
ncbi:MAG: hypothetical protein QOD06_2949 [Candidatus Binatota bacterium]|nr:hypothetical protein [Candidatus Binatota bacterium]